MKIREDRRERKVPKFVGVGATGMAEVGAVGIAMSTIVLDSSRMFVAKKMDP